MKKQTYIFEKKPKGVNSTPEMVKLLVPVSSDAESVDISGKTDKGGSELTGQELEDLANTKVKAPSGIMNTIPYFVSENEIAGSFVYVNNSDKKIEIISDEDTEVLSIEHGGDSSAISIFKKNYGTAIFVNSTTDQPNVILQNYANNGVALTVQQGITEFNDVVKIAKLVASSATQFMVFDSQSRVKYLTTAQMKTSLGIVSDSQIPVSTSQNAQANWDRKTIIFDTNCTITVPATLVEQYEFSFIIKKGVTVTWAITAPFVWYLENPPAPMVGSIAQSKGYFLRELATNNIHLEF